VLPLIAVPTTAGTGSEVARGAIVIVDDGRKLGFHSWHLMPKAALLDPELTLGLPPGLTAATGMDAIAHCMETFMAPAVNPPADGIALDGLARGWAHIERATRDGQDRDARWNMMSASMQGAMAFQKGLGCVHSLSHSLGGVNPRLHHGTLNAMFLPAVVRFNAAADSIQRERRLQRMAQAMGLPAATAAAPKWPRPSATMNARLGLPGGLAAMGVTRTCSNASSTAPWPTTATRPTRAWPRAATTGRGPVSGPPGRRPGKAALCRLQVLARGAACRVTGRTGAPRVGDGRYGVLPQQHTSGAPCRPGTSNCRSTSNWPTSWPPGCWTANRPKATPCPRCAPWPASYLLNPLTVNRALQALGDEGLLENRRGLGMYVRPARANACGRRAPALPGTRMAAPARTLRRLGLGAEQPELGGH
jgi:hypothetical protein